MKKIISTIADCMLATISAFAQYNISTSTTTHRNSYGQTTGTSTTGKTDIFGNTTTQQRSNTGTGIWTW